MTRQVVLVNDTSMHNAHFGTQLVGQTFREQLSRVGCDLIGAIGLDAAGHRDLLERADLVIINGEGSIHHGRNLPILELAEHYPCVLVNCVWQDNPPLPALHAMKLVTVRESLSGARLDEQGVPYRIVPDVSFASMLLRAHQRQGPTEDIGLTDNVRARDSGFSPFTDNPHRYLREMGRFARLCVGRFHAAVAASVLGIPFSTWPSNTHKTEGMMHDMGVLHLHAATQDEAAAICPRAVDPKVTRYAAEAHAKVLELFDEIARLAAQRGQ
jgi:hypothetical protein